VIPQVKIHVEPTTNCNRNCSFCRPAIPTRIYIDPKCVERLILQLEKMAWDKCVHFSGMGEPTMHPDFLHLVQFARGHLPDAQISVYTNGDFLTVEMLRHLWVVDWIAWDVYAEDATAKRMANRVRASGFPPERMRVVDQVRYPVRVVSRAGALFNSADAKKFWDMPCHQPLEQLCMCANGDWGLCCNDVRWRKQWPGELSPEALNADPDFIATVEALKERRHNVPLCRECEIPAVGNPWHGRGPARFCPTIDKSRFWNFE